MKGKSVILVVDDEVKNIELLEAYLIPQGYEIVKAANGEEALEKLSGNQIDLILLDVLMPGMNGFEVIRRVRQDNTHRLLPIILVTELRETEDRVKGIEAGCDDFISYPVDKMELLARVRSLLKVEAYNDLMSNYQKDLESEADRRTSEIKHALEDLQQEITDRKRAEEKIRASLAEKELLLKEVHHRVKNNLQIIISLIRLQSRSVEDAVALKAFDESISRIHSMALVHEQLYSSNDFANIPFKKYVEEIANHLVRNFSMYSRISFNLNIQNIALGIDTAIPFGLILNELLINSLKYAFPDGQKGIIKISMRLKKDKNYELIFRDNGIGLGRHTEVKETGSFGMKLIKMLTEQIHGKLVLTGDEGTCYKITFPKDQN